MHRGAAGGSAVDFDAAARIYPRRLCVTPLEDFDA